MSTETFSDRLHYAKHCMPRDKDGGAPTDKDIEERAGLSGSSISKIMYEGREPRGTKRYSKLAEVLGVTTDWLLKGEGVAPSLTGPLPPRPGALDREPWRPAFMARDTGNDLDALIDRDLFTTRRPVLAVLRARGENDLVRALLAERHDEGDPGIKDPDYWWSRPDFYRHKIKVHLDGRAAASALDHVPGEPKK